MDAPRAPSSVSSGEKKRKRSSPAYYAVKAGHIPGVYLNWDDVKAQIKGYSDPIHRKFSSLVEAEAFLNDKSSPSAASTTSGTSRPKSAQQKFYGVSVGHVPGVYTDYEEVKRMTKGFPKSKQKSFPTEDEAWAFVLAAHDPSYVSVSAAASTKGDVDSEISGSIARQGCKVGDNPAKKQKKNNGTAFPTDINGNYELGTGPLPLDAEDGFDRTIKFNAATGTLERKTEAELSARKLHPTGDISGPLIIYTDGSALGNGQKGAVGGVGVYFGANDPRNVSEPLPGEKQTNQRAELVAIQRAVDIAPIDKDVHIYSDSNYAIKCVTEWFTKWRTNGWKNAAGKDVDNRDIIKPIIQRIDERKLARADTKFTWVKGHASTPGNMAADALAVNGARQAQELLATERELTWG